MKIEKVNEHQIRCTLTREDLDNRQIKLSELAYGSEKAKLLFKDMMHQASTEFGFDAEDIPLMIEAVPLSAETIMLIITKVEAPEELDTRFSNFSTPSDTDESEDSADTDNPFFRDSTKEMLDFFMRMSQEKQENLEEAYAKIEKRRAKPADTMEATQAEEKPAAPVETTTKMFALDSLDTAITLAQLLKGFYTGDNALYKDTRDGSYHLVIRQGAHSLSEFYKVYNTIAGYGKPETYTPGCEAFYKEHAKTILASKALQALVNI